MIKSERLKDINEYYFSSKLKEIAQLRSEGKNILNLGIGSPDLPPHSSVIETLHQTALQPNSHGYQSYIGDAALRKAMSDFYFKYYHVELNPHNEILPLIGSKEGIMHICMTYLNQGDQVLIPNPGYPTYTSAVKLAGGEPRYYDLNDKTHWKPNFKLIAQQDLSKVKMMWVNYPHMPSGTNSDVQLFEEIVEFGLKHSILICHDNPYSFILNDHPLSLLRVQHAKKIVIELNSLSKSHNMAGWRVGMICSNATFIHDILCFKSNMDSGMFLGIQRAAQTALNLDQNWFSELNKVYKKRQIIARNILEKIGCEVTENQVGLFLWAKIPSTYSNAYELSDNILYNHQIFITPGGIFGSNGETYLRISLCATEETLLQALKQLTS
ncbi:MAG: aminotransferase class I/II-fold pyridoxal phosphate-dependent enzyme [Sediminibacterium sp.]|nr:aminotransferase class I/II-fold pyridoxal phosphate-dependent enzyme [Sediminibacterium sp.]